MATPNRPMRDEPAPALGASRGDKLPGGEFQVSRLQFAPALIVPARMDWAIESPYSANVSYVY